MSTSIPLAFIFGGIPEFFLGGFLYIVVSILASIKVVQETKGSATPVWLAFIWLAPCLGGILALIAVKRTPKGMDP